MSAFQGAVILLFNQKNCWQFHEIMTATKISFDVFGIMLFFYFYLVKYINMGCHHNRIAIDCWLRKRGTEKNIEYKVNAAYTNRAIRVKVNQVQIEETKHEHQSTSEKIFHDRQYQIDACIVRILKARKTLTHQQLMVEVLKQLRFEADPKQMKKRIATLIENEYMERDKDNSSVYHYKA
ncbi:hypothetical protein RFI_23908 [Reticulomyxa filosa]|uniref:Cullin neddylation domain-containing protein n=1 Tax=Reticulomyxa filosa TaxID=46433 RepID=X6MHY0_RETFI|nr:hypothetical protein RFI_23908 [Reticulomyxa filosa]|eukprot:ETO13464.1 hypothetical protein RFI_23908 [Reticulomyxa filosa]